MSASLVLSQYGLLQSQLSTASDALGFGICGPFDILAMVVLDILHIDLTSMITAIYYLTD